MPGQTESYWVASAPGPDLPVLPEDVDVDVCVIGAGIAGIATATILKEAGKRVALIDARDVVHGCTGYTSAKVTSSHGIIYKHLTKSFGEEGARTYGAANEAGLAWVADRVDREAIDCAFERRPNFVYTEDPDEVSTLHEEVDAAQRAGLSATFTTETDLPFDVRGAVRFDDQAQFHPRDYLLALVDGLPGDGSHVFTRTPATEFEENGRCSVTTERGRITSDDVVITTHLPIFDRGLFFAKAHPYNSYCVAGEMSGDLHGMYISTGGGPTRSMRSIAGPNGRLLLVSGNGHKVGADSPTGKNYGDLEDFGRRWWDVDSFPYRWSAHDYISVDKVPFVGRFTRLTDHAYVATGFGKWGMSNGIAAALMISDRILGRTNPWAEFFDAKRINLAQVKKSVTENVEVGVRFVADRLPSNESIEDLVPGQGVVTSEGVSKIAAYRDDDGTLHKMSAVCTHLGCIVGWNDGDRTWDCPCHGSRFSAEGEVVNGPAIEPLKRLD